MIDDDQMSLEQQKKRIDDSVGWKPNEWLVGLIFIAVANPDASSSGDKGRGEEQLNDMVYVRFDLTQAAPVLKWGGFKTARFLHTVTLSTMQTATDNNEKKMIDW